MSFVNNPMAVGSSLLWIFGVAGVRKCVVLYPPWLTLANEEARGLVPGTSQFHAQRKVRSVGAPMLEPRGTGKSSRRPLLRMPPLLLFVVDAIAETTRMVWGLGFPHKRMPAEVGVNTFSVVRMISHRSTKAGGSLHSSPQIGFQKGLSNQRETMAFCLTAGKQNHF
jgi:hypothetical protein